MKLSIYRNPAKFIERLNRFCCLVEIEGQRLPAHLANSGRMQELLLPGSTVYLVERPGYGRKTSFDLALVAVTDRLVSVDARVPSALFHEAFLAGKLPQFQAYATIQREVMWEDSRMDFLLGGDTSRCLVEVKSVTLVKGGRALFPDAPTGRGRKHVGTLTRALDQGLAAAMVFVVQRQDAQVFSPNVSTDPQFAAALARAADVGVSIRAYDCQVNLDEIAISSALPVEFHEFHSSEGLP